MRSIFSVLFQTQKNKDEHFPAVCMRQAREGLLDKLPTKESVDLEHWVEIKKVWRTRRQHGG